MTRLRLIRPIPAIAVVALALAALPFTGFAQSPQPAHPMPMQPGMQMPMQGQMPTQGQGQMPMQGQGQMPMQGQGQMPMQGQGQMPMMPMMQMMMPMGQGGGMGMMGPMQQSQMPMQPGMQMQGAAGRMLDRIEGRIAFLQAELRINQTQMPAWSEFAGALRTQAKRLAELHGAMPQSPTAGSKIPALLEHHEHRLAARLEGARALRSAYSRVHAVLDDAQKLTADELVWPHLGLS